MPDITFDDLIPRDGGRSQQGGVQFNDLTPPPVPGRGAEPKPAWWQSLLQGIGQGVSMGWGDELMAAVKTMGGMAGDYGAELENQRAGLDRAREANPGWYMGGEIGGNLPMMAIPVGAAARGLTMAGKIGRGLLAGGVQGGIYGAGTGEGTEGKMGGAALGAGLGAGIGAAIPPAAGVIGAGAARILRGRVPRLSPAQEMVSGSFMADAGDAAKVSALGPEGMLLDMGPNLRQEAAAVAARPGEGQRIIRDALAQREAGAGGRVVSMLDRSVGPQVDDTFEDMVDRQRRQAGPLYDRAYAQPTPISPGLQEAIFNRMPRQAWAFAQKLAQAEGVPFSRELVHTGDTRSLDFLQRGLGQAIETVGPKTQLGRAYSELSRQMGDELTAANLPLKQARDLWHDVRSVEEAVESGREIFTRSVLPRELYNGLARMTTAEREAFKRGARDAIAQIMGTARNDAEAAYRELAQKGWGREKLAILLGKDEADRLLAGLRQERTFAESSQQITRNSETVRREAGMDRLTGQSRRSGAVTGAVAGATATGTATGMGIGAAVGFVRDVFMKGADKALSVPPAELDRIAAEMARMLTATGRERDQAVAVLTQLRTKQFATQQTRDAAARVLRGVLAGIGAAGQPLLEEARR